MQKYEDFPVLPVLAFHCRVESAIMFCTGRHQRHLVAGAGNSYACKNRGSIAEAEQKWESGPQRNLCLKSGQNIELSKSWKVGFVSERWNLGRKSSRLLRMARILNQRFVTKSEIYNQSSEVALINNISTAITS